jgi:hypothetical protein
MHVRSSRTVLVMLPTIWTTIAVVLAVGCHRDRTEAPSTQQESRSTTTTDQPSAAQQALDRMDTRVAVPLVPMMANHQKQDMRDHLLAVQEIVVAASTDDFAAVERAAERMGYSEEVGQMCTHMGAGAPGFTEQALNFHHTADTIATAARQRDHAAVIRGLNSTLQTCTGCHAKFRQSVVDEATWNFLTSMPAPAGHVPGK